LKKVTGDFDEAHEKAIEEQEEIDTDFLSELDPLRERYFNGLAKKAAALAKLGNTVAQETLVEEADKTVNSMPRFIRILRDEDPDPVAEQEE
jgi:hypothetical protein